MEPDEESIRKWLRKRIITSSRAYATNFLAKLGLNEKDTKGIIDNAPIFDNGLSLWGFAMENELDDISAYVNTRTPATYSNFMEFAKHYITNSQKQKLHKLQNFKFKKHPRYNWSKKILKTVERVIQERVELLLK